MVGGTDTTAHSMTSAMYYLKKYPEVLQKLRKEMSDNGFSKGANLEEIFTMEKIQSLEYLGYVIKEALRIDSPTIEGFDYQAYEDVVVCDVPIPKGTIFKIDVYTGHFDDKSWLHSKDFIPERFDMDSDFYKQSLAAGKNKNSYSRRTFSHGARNCPGQTLALLEMRIILLFFLMHTDYEVDEAFLTKEGVGFGLATDLELEIKVKKF